MFRKRFFLLLWLFAMPLAVIGGKPVNKTVYRIPGKEENRKTLAKAWSLARKKELQAPFCLSCHIHISLENDHSGRIDFTEEYFLPTAVKTPLRQDYTNTFVELILPDGSYRSYHSPRKIPHIKGSMVYVKYTRNLPPRSTLDFLLDLPLNLPCKVGKMQISISSLKYEKTFHSLLPPPGGKGVAIKKMGRFSYLLGEVPEQVKGKTPLILRVSFHPDWSTFGTRYHEKYFTVKKLPEPLKKKAHFLQKNTRLAPEEKLRLLAALLPSLPPTGRLLFHTQMAYLAEAGRLAGVEVYPALCTTSPSPNLAVAGNIFPDLFLCIREEGKLFFRQLSGGKLEMLPDSYSKGTALILRGNSCQFRKIPPTTGNKAR